MDFGLVYILGYLWFYRYTTGYTLNEMFDSGGYRPDGFDITMGMILGMIINLVWPLLVTGRVVYVLGSKFGPSDPLNLFDTVFPGPREIESKAEKRERLNREREHRIREARRTTNERERELGMELTKW